MLYSLSILLVVSIYPIIDLILEDAFILLRAADSLGVNEDPIVLLAVGLVVLGLGAVVVLDGAGWVGLVGIVIFSSLFTRFLPFRPPTVPFDERWTGALDGATATGAVGVAWRTIATFETGALPCADGTTMALAFALVVTLTFVLANEVEPLCTGDLADTPLGTGTGTRPDCGCVLIFSLAISFVITDCMPFTPAVVLLTVGAGLVGPVVVVLWVGLIVLVVIP